MLLYNNNNNNNSNHHHHHNNGSSSGGGGGGYSSVVHTASSPIISNVADDASDDNNHYHNHHNTKITITLKNNGGSSNSSSSSSSGTWDTLMLCAKNIISSVLIIVVNKSIMVSGFKFIMFLTTLHFIVTSAFVHMYRYIQSNTNSNISNNSSSNNNSSNSSNNKNKSNKSYLFAFPWQHVLLIAFLNMVSIVSMNLSLLTNSVGMYQITKMMCIPAMVLVESIWLKSYSNQIKLSLFILLIGVCGATVTDLQINLIGSIVAIVAVLSTTLAQISLSQASHKYKVSSLDMTASILPIQSILCLIGAIPTDICMMRLKNVSFEDLTIFDYFLQSFSDGQVVLLICLSCLLSVAANYSGISLLAHTSPVTFQVVGHFKTCFILISGYLLFPDPSASLSDSIKNLASVMVAVLGVVLYGHFKSVPTSSTSTSLGKY